MAAMKDFRKELLAQVKRASVQGRPHVEINAGELNRIVSPTETRLPMACKAMREMMTATDYVVYEPPAGNGASLTINYKLPRKS